MGKHGLPETGDRRQVTDVFDGCLSIGSTGLMNWSFLFKEEDLSKRQMFGRAHLDLLRVKVLHAV